MMKHLFRAITLAALALLCTARPSTAAPILSIVPGFQSGNIGSLFSVDILISGLEGESVGSFDLDISFSPGIIGGQTLTLGAGLGDPNDPSETFDLSTGFSGAVIDVAQVSLLTASSLLALQGGDSFTLATLVFSGLAAGTSPLTITQAIFANGDGNAMQVGTLGGSIQVLDNVQPVPEPSTMLLFGSAAAAAAYRKRRQMRRTI